MQRALVLILLVIFVVGLAFAQPVTKATSSASDFRTVKDKPAKPFSSIKQQKIEPEVLAAGSDTIDVIVEGDLKGINTLEKKKLGIGNFHSAKMRKSEVQKLEKSASVKKVWLEKSYKPLLDVSLPLINASSFYASGYNGSGINVCVIDTGINSSHPALSSRVVAEKDFVTTDSDGDNPMDYNGHGTHVAGIVASNDSVYRGVAPAANILNAKVFSSSTNTALSSKVMEAIYWCINQNASILTMSLGGEFLNDGSDELSQYADAAVDAGKIITVSAGNNGPSSGTINCPGCAHKIISVGAVYKQSYASVSWPSCTDDSPQRNQIGCFSSRGPTYDGRILPDVSAPGAIITSAYYKGGWIGEGGTSMSTPMVAGLAALALQAKNMTPAELKALLMNTAVELGTAGKDNAYGAGSINGTRMFAEINNTITGAIRNESAVYNIFVNGSVRATLYWPEDWSYHSDLDLYLLDPAGNVRASSTSQYNTDEIINMSSPEPAGYWKLLIDPYNVSGNQTYAIASSAGLSEKMRLKTGNVSNVAYHQINVSTNNLTISLDWNFTAVEMDLYLYNTTGSLINQSAANNTNHESVYVRNPEQGTWLARVVSDSSAQYSLSSSSWISDQITDSSSPNVSISSPANRTYNSSNINLTFSATDNFAAFVECNISVSGTALLTIRSNSTASSNFSVADGSRNSTVACADLSNNRGNATVNFSIDTVAPNATFVFPSDANNSAVARSYTFINVSVTDVGSVDSCTLVWNGAVEAMTKSVSGNYVSCYINKTDAIGNYLYSVLINDSAGNVALERRTVALTPAVYFNGGNGSAFSPNGDGVYDRINFTVTMDRTVNFSTTRLYAANRTRVKSFSKVDNVQSISKLWNGCFTDDCGAGFVPDGVYTIEITINQSGYMNSTNLTETITVDTTPMALSLNAPNNETISSGSVTINATTSEVPAELYVKWNGVNYSMSGNGTYWSRTFVNLYGNYTFHVHARDSVANWNASETRWVYVNHTINATPLMARMSALATRNVSAALLDAENASASDRIIPTERYTLRFNASGIMVEMADFLGYEMNTSAATDIVTSIAGEGNVSASFEQLGGVRDSYVWIDVNGTLPGGSFTPKVRFPLRKIYFYLNGSQDAPNAVRANACNATISNVPCYSQSGTDMILYLPSFSGAAAGNDTQAPSLVVASPTATTYDATSIKLNYTTGDNVAVDKCWYRLNNNDAALSNCANATITAAEGSNTLTVFVNDTSNNTNQTAISFSVSTSSPTPTPTASSSGSGGSTTMPAATPTPTPTPTTKPATKPNRVPTQTPKQQVPAGASYESSPPVMQNTTAISPATGFVLVSYGNAIAGFAAGVFIVGAAWLWKMRSTSQKRRQRKGTRFAGKP